MKIIICKILLIFLILKNYYSANLEIGMNEVTDLVISVKKLYIQFKNDSPYIFNNKLNPFKILGSKYIQLLNFNSHFNINKFYKNIISLKEFLESTINKFPLYSIEDKNKAMNEIINRTKGLLGAEVLNSLII